MLKFAPRQRSTKVASQPGLQTGTTIASCRCKSLIICAPYRIRTGVTGARASQGPALAALHETRGGRISGVSTRSRYVGGHAVRSVKQAAVRDALEAYLTDLKRHGRADAAREARGRFKLTR